MNIYFQKIKEIAIQNKYTKWYIQICINAKQRSSSKNQANEILKYSESHHILPKSFKLGGEKDKENLVFLSAKEHFYVIK